MITFDMYMATAHNPTFINGYKNIYIQKYICAGAFAKYNILIITTSCVFGFNFVYAQKYATIHDFLYDHIHRFIHCSHIRFVFFFLVCFLFWSTIKMLNFDLLYFSSFHFNYSKVNWLRTISISRTFIFALFFWPLLFR